MLTSSQIGSTSPPCLQSLYTSSYPPRIRPQQKHFDFPEAAPFTFTPQSLAQPFSPRSVCHPLLTLASDLTRDPDCPFQIPSSFEIHFPQLSLDDNVCYEILSIGSACLGLPALSRPFRSAAQSLAIRLHRRIPPWRGYPPSSAILGLVLSCHPISSSCKKPEYSLRHSCTRLTLGRGVNIWLRNGRSII